MLEPNHSQRSVFSWLTVAAGHRAKFVILALWIGVLAITFPLAANLENVLRDDPISYLPRSAESTQVATLMKTFPSGAVTPAVIIFGRENGLNQSDQDWVEQFRSDLNRNPPIATQTINTPEFSEDGKAGFLIAPIEALDQSAVLVEAVQELRQRITAPVGLTVKVSGPAGNRADLETVFDSIEGVTFLATAGLILLLLVLIYRSPIFWLIPFAAAICTDFVARGLIHLTAMAGLIVNDQSANILPVFVFGAGTDFALLLVARYREELYRNASRHQAMAIALRQAAPAIIASAMTTIVALVALLLAELNGVSGLAAVAAIGIGVAMVSMLTLLPALLLVAGRIAFFPFIPRHDSPIKTQAEQGLWWRVGTIIARHPRPFWISSIGLLLIMCLGLTGFNTGLNRVNSYLSDVEAVQGMELIYQSFPKGVNAPGTVIVQNRSRTEAVRSMLQSSPEVADIGTVESGTVGDRFSFILNADPYSEITFQQIPILRQRVKQVGGDTTLIGGATAEESDVRVFALRDERVVIPLVLVLVLIVLIVLLRSLVAPVMLIVTVILSFAAALGTGTFVSQQILGFAGMDASLPLIAFVFLVAGGVDYIIFLMSRAREEAHYHGTKMGMIRALSMTGSVITSAGIVSAGTFGALAILPLALLIEFGFILAFGVLLDTFLVRSILVPALVQDLGAKVWFPSKLSRYE